MVSKAQGMKQRTAALEHVSHILMRIWTHEEAGNCRVPLKKQPAWHTIQPSDCTTILTLLARPSMGQESISSADQIFVQLLKSSINKHFLIIVDATAASFWIHNNRQFHFTTNRQVYFDKYGSSAYKTLWNTTDHDWKEVSATLQNENERCKRHDYDEQKEATKFSIFPAFITKQPALKNCWLCSTKDT